MERITEENTDISKVAGPLQELSQWHLQLLSDGHLKLPPPPACNQAIKPQFLPQGASPGLNSASHRSPLVCSAGPPKLCKQTEISAKQILAMCVNIYLTCETVYSFMAGNGLILVQC